MNNQLCKSVLVFPMSVTQADLLVVFLEKTNWCVIKILDEILKFYPKDAIMIIVNAQLTR